MKELIKVSVNENDEQLVSGRELHEFCWLERLINDGFERITEYGFAENVDFTVIAKNVHDRDSFWWRSYCY